MDGPISEVSDPKVLDDTEKEGEGGGRRARHRFRRRQSVHPVHL